MTPGFSSSLATQPKTHSFGAPEWQQYSNSTRYQVVPFSSVESVTSTKWSGSRIAHWVPSGTSSTAAAPFTFASVPGSISAIGRDGDGATESEALGRTDALGDGCGTSHCPPRPTPTTASSTTTAPATAVSHRRGCEVGAASRGSAGIG